MKSILNEAYNSNKKAKRFIEVFAKRLTPDQTNTQAPTTEQIEITFRNIDDDDAKQISSSIVPNAKIFKSTKTSKNGTFKLTAISFLVPDAKFAKWLRMVLPKIQTVLENSNNTIYQNLNDFQNKVMDAVYDAPSQVTTERAQKSIKELEEAIYKAIKENRMDDALAIYKKAITLIAREYGHQLSPNNVKSIYAQAEAAGISPSDKGAATNSYWPDGTEKFWPTFVRSRKAWRENFGRTVKDEPKMQYAMNTVNGVKADAATIDKRLKSQGFNSIGDASLQQREKLKSGGFGNGFKGVGYDYSDTEGPGDFFLSPGLLNNLDGTLTDAAIIDNDTWLKKIQDLKSQDSQFQLSDNDKRKERASSEEGQAEIFIEAMEKLSQIPRYEGGWKEMGISIQKGGDPVTSYLLTVQDVAKKRLEINGWNNKVNVDKIAQMVTAAVALSTVGQSKVKNLGYDFSNVGSIFSSFEDCKSTVLGVSDHILSSLHKMTSKEKDEVNENVISKFFTLLERIENRYNDCYNYELNEGLIHRPNDNVIMGFLEKLGLNMPNENPMDIENTENAV
jgi:hypothetical protein